MKQKKSVCGEFVAKFTTYVGDGEIVETSTGAVYDKDPDDVEGGYFAKAHMVGHYSANMGADGRYSKDLCRVTLLDCVAGKRIDPWTGNTVTRSRTVFFKVKNQ